MTNSFAANNAGQITKNSPTLLLVALKTDPGMDSFTSEYRVLSMFLTVDGFCDFMNLVANEITSLNVRFVLTFGSNDCCDELLDEDDDLADRDGFFFFLLSSSFLL